MQRARKLSYWTLLADTPSLLVSGRCPCNLVWRYTLCAPSPGHQPVPDPLCVPITLHLFPSACHSLRAQCLSLHTPSYSQAQIRASTYLKLLPDSPPATGTSDPLPVPLPSLPSHLLELPGLWVGCLTCFHSLQTIGSSMGSQSQTLVSAQL